MTISEEIADELYGLHCDIGRLETENARLRQQCVNLEDKYHALVTENAKLRDMLGRDVRLDDKVQRAAR